MTQGPTNQTSVGSDEFVSYASQDAAVANSIVENLEQHGIKCWIAPRDVTPGSQYADEIVGAINDTQVFVLDAVRGWLRYAYLWDWTGAQSDIEKAMARDAGNSTVQIRYSTLLGALGRISDATAAAKKAIAADPLSAAAQEELARWFINSGQFPAARDALNRALQISPESLWGFYRLEQTELLDGNAEIALAHAGSGQPDARLIFTALAAHTLGRNTESEQALAELISQFGKIDAYQIAEIYAWQGKTDKALEWLERSYTHHDFGLIDIKTDPFMASARPDPRFRAFLMKMNLPSD